MNRIDIHCNIGIKGFLRFQTVNIHSGEITQDTGFFPNLILVAGRNAMADFDFMTHCQVGTDNTAPTVNDTSLLGHIEGTAQIEETTNGQEGTPPYYGWKRKRFRFNPGLIGGENLKEAGVGWGLSGSTLISRALIIDPILETPTVITPLSDEFLDITYELRYYAPTVDVDGPQVVLDGVTYDTKTRAANVTSSLQSFNIGTKMGVVTGRGGWKSYSGTIGTVLLGPNGTGIDCGNDSQYNSSYLDNSYEIQVNCSAASAGWNQDIRSILITTTAGQFQTEFTSNPGGLAIPKTASYSMLMNWTFGWTAL